MLDFWRSSIGKKVVMAVTGLIGVAFVIGHMLGNLQVFIGPEKFNSYAAFLQGPGKELVWAMRGVLLASLVLHVVAAVQLTQRARAARPAGYATREPQASTLASRWMRIGGVILLAFIIYHLLHFTGGVVDPGHASLAHDATGRHDVYANVVASFRVWWVTAFYTIAMIFLGLHLYHGAWSSVRSLGVSKPSRQPLHRTVALGVAIIVWLGFTIVPLGVALGVVR